jgi:hypothetical protein
MGRVRASVRVATLLAAGAVASPALAADCDPMQTPATFRGTVPTPEFILGSPIGSREVTTEESDRYVTSVDASSVRVVSGVMGRSVRGKPLRYAIVGNPANVTTRGLNRIRAAMYRLQDPRTPLAEVRRLARTTPAILWIAANVHGDEESGTEASLRVLHELADRSDCTAAQVLDNAIVVLQPVQNPDGRDADTRRNAYGFDLNRDWFARTQPETDAKVELLRRFPPQVFVDAHEMGTPTYFFPPNADPVYHDISSQAVNWINKLYGPALIREFQRQRIPFFNRARYDLFYMGYGDTVPSAGFGAAGMTFEKNNRDPMPQRAYEQYVTQWVTLATAAKNRVRILQDWHAQWVQAERQGRQGRLEPNELIDTEATIVRQVPNERVRHYFIRTNVPGKAREVQELVRRLQRMDVRVYRLTEPLRVRDFKPYGRSRRVAVLPAGTMWVPMAQRQKHWIQAMLNEDTYVPFEYFYDATGWSQPLLLNLSGGRSGLTLAPSAREVRQQGRPTREAIPRDEPRIGVLQLSSNTAGVESFGWLRFMLDRQWRVPYKTVANADILAGGLGQLDVLVAPGGSVAQANAELGPVGRAAIEAWVRAGGRFIGWGGGAALGAQSGVTTATLATPTAELPGSLFRVRMNTRSQLARNVGAENWAFLEETSTLLLRASNPAHVAAAYPPAGHRDFFVSGYAKGAEEFGSTAAIVDEPTGSGRVVLFGFEPNFRAFTQGTQRVLWNALFARSTGSGGGSGPAPGSANRPPATARAAAAARRVSTGEGAILVTVPAARANAARAALTRYGARFAVRRIDGRTTFRVANPRGLTADQHPWVRLLAGDLRARGVSGATIVTP